MKKLKQYRTNKRYAAGGWNEEWGFVATQPTFDNYGTSPIPCLIIFEFLFTNSLIADLPIHHRNIIKWINLLFAWYQWPNFRFDNEFLKNPFSNFKNRKWIVREIVPRTIGYQIDDDFIDELEYQIARETNSLTHFVWFQILSLGVYLL